MLTGVFLDYQKSGLGLSVDGLNSLFWGRGVKDHPSVWWLIVVRVRSDAQARPGLSDGGGSVGIDCARLRQCQPSTQADFACAVPIPGRPQYRCMKLGG